ncbi:GSCFA domain-containing protein [Rhizobium sp. BK602]|uniref:GSCFA domain-containing protein n=1 Tax=Rhizobium sp. BK602 TaxID=2586986 RepID=UPI0016130614|nr:GSCFA domain-containing protein [Rhizobium sp. BK602]MBB3612597.1 hypothetical protein [Rhizobium sp. BK602]
MKKKHPYIDLPDYAFWSRSVGKVAVEDIDPVVFSPKFIKREHRIATAGSCFAQHLARRLSLIGYNYYISEDISPVFGDAVAKEQGYRVFSARYGNIYTARQLLQLFKRAYGTITPEDDHWNTKHVYVDPLRPTVQPGGYKTLSELRGDREHHLKCVREMFEGLDVFIFTLGLTESWISTVDGIVYPICPGVSDGVFNPDKHKFHNFTYDEILSDMREFIDLLRGVNPLSRVILTVSPVPLAATKEKQHVLVATTYSKSVLRVVCETISQEYKDIYYFPSYEIVTGQHAAGAYYASNLRDIAEIGVDHVMRVFSRHFLASSSQEAAPIVKTNDSDFRIRQASEAFVEVECDEQLLEG